MKAMSGVVPWAVVLAVAGGAIWWMLGREMTVGRWLLAAIALGHGLVHVLFAVPNAATEPDWPFGMKSWVVGGAGTDAGLVRMSGAVLIAVTVVGFALTALATIGVIVPATWWQPTVAASGAVSALVLVLFFDPQLVLGLVVDVALVWVAIAGVWHP